MPLPQPPKGMIVQSHRGAGELEAENTLAAFELGWKYGTYPEADVRQTSDGVIVAFHDNDFKRVTKDCPPELIEKGIADISFDQLSKLRVGMYKDGKFVPHEVPRLTEVFKLMSGHPERHLYMDIKKVDLGQLAREAKQYDVCKQVILAAPDHSTILAWKKLVPESDTLLWMGGTDDQLTSRMTALRAANFEGITQLQVHTKLKTKPEEIKRDTPDPFTPSDRFIRSVAAEIKPRGILFQTLPYGGSTQEIYWKLLDLGLQSFATDRPDITIDALKCYVGPAK